MKKEALFRKMIDRDVWGALTEVYGIKCFDLTENQQKLVESISNRLYVRFGKSLTIKDLQEMLEENWINNEELPNALQKD